MKVLDLVKWIADHDVKILVAAPTSPPVGAQSQLRG
jgi:hypothetical protein